MKTLLRTFAIVAASVSLLAACANKSDSTSATADMTLGKDTAPVTMVEYASVTCSHCARFDRDVFQTIRTKYIDTGRVHYVFKEFLTPPEAAAASGFLLARCAGKDKYFDVIEAMFRSQEESFRTGDFRTTYLRIAKSAGMTEEQFATCVNDSKALDALQTRVQNAIEKDKVNGTPTIFVNGKQIGSGEIPLDKLEAAILEAEKNPAKK
jgi:protein-disulfide isomerase